MKSDFFQVVLFGKNEQHVLNSKLYFLLNIEWHLLYVVIKGFEHMLHPCHFSLVHEYLMRRLHLEPHYILTFCQIDGNGLTRKSYSG